MKINQTLQKINQLMDERGWTYYRLAKESGIPYSSLNSLFLKNNQPTISTLEKICSGFHITMAEFFSDETPYRAESYRFSKSELDIIEMFRNLNPSEKKILTAYIRGYCRKSP